MPAIASSHGRKLRPNTAQLQCYVPVVQVPGAATHWDTFVRSERGSNTAFLARSWMTSHAYSAVPQRFIADESRPAAAGTPALAAFEDIEMQATGVAQNGPVDASLEPFDVQASPCANAILGNVYGVHPGLMWPVCGALQATAGVACIHGGAFVFDSYLRHLLRDPRCALTPTFLVGSAAGLLGALYGFTGPRFARDAKRIAIATEQAAVLAGLLVTGGVVACLIWASRQMDSPAYYCDSTLVYKIPPFTFLPYIIVLAPFAAAGGLGYGAWRVGRHVKKFVERSVADAPDLS